jgi:ketosteroid isomerase-like protein
MQDNANLELQHRFVSAVFAGDDATIRSLCHPEFELLQGAGMAFAGSYRGADGFLEFLRIFNETLEIERLEPVRTFLCDDPDRIVTQFEVSATVRSSGERFDSGMLELWTFRDGKVLGCKAHYFNAMPSVR